VALHSGHPRWHLISAMPSSQPEGIRRLSIGDQQEQAMRVPALTLGIHSRGICALASLRPIRLTDCVNRYTDVVGFTERINALDRCLAIRLLITASSFRRRIIVKVDGRSANSHASEVASLGTITQISVYEWNLQPKIQIRPSIGDLTGAQMQTVTCEINAALEMGLRGRSTGKELTLLNKYIDQNCAVPSLIRSPGRWRAPQSRKLVPRFSSSSKRQQ
jgi:hypothetical protein